MRVYVNEQILNEWQHTVWTLAPTEGDKAEHKAYLNGVLMQTWTAYFPANMDRTKNYIGRSNWYVYVCLDVCM
jgi:hypothetical protein